MPEGVGNQIPVSKCNLRSCGQVYNPANEGGICSFSGELGMDFSEFLHKEEDLAPKTPKDLHQSDFGNFRSAFFQPGPSLGYLGIIHRRMSLDLPWYIPDLRGDPLQPLPASPATALSEECWNPGKADPVLVPNICKPQSPSPFLQQRDGFKSLGFQTRQERNQSGVHQQVSSNIPHPALCSPKGAKDIWSR